MPTSRAILTFFFADCGDGFFSCTHCGKARKQTAGTGYTNLISLLKIKHPGYDEMYEESQRNASQTLDAHGI
ncbi:uncharacterized protein IUM83_19446 [Phytophthora cinnamomi]|uniref:uncharacterized protein n=1 Tax=Phytophthora cinnamomi TaxID=4785 RepID=UPI00355A797A|nr:hypothetical protein IUM83_19446 [Phytophthora cinnamomi]